MKRIILSLALLVIGATSAFASAKSSSTRQITQVIEQYFSVLGTSNAGALTELFTEDAELLPPGAPTATGREQIQGTYEYVFSAMRLDLSVTIERVTILGNYALVSSSSAGKITMLPSGQTTDGNRFRETFILRKIKGQWRIARYIYNTPS